MLTEPGDLNLKSEAKKKIIRQGGTHELMPESNEYFDEWLLFLTNPVNLRAGLPDFTIALDSRRMDSSTIRVSFDKNKASLRVLKLDLTDFHDGNTEIFQETDPAEKKSLVDGAPAMPDHLRKWVFNLLLHTELRELHIQFLNRKIEAGLHEVFAGIPRLKLNLVLSNWPD